VLRDLAQLSYPEIAEQLGVPVGTVKSRVHDGRKLLRGSLGVRVSRSRRPNAPSARPIPRAEPRDGETRREVAFSPRGARRPADPARGGRDARGGLRRGRDHCLAGFAAHAARCAGHRAASHFGRRVARGTVSQQDGRGPAGGLRRRARHGRVPARGSRSPARTQRATRARSTTTRIPRTPRPTGCRCSTALPSTSPMAAPRHEHARSTSWSTRSSGINHAASSTSTPTIESTWCGRTSRP
jgi:sigma-70-like protein